MRASHILSIIPAMLLGVSCQSSVATYSQDKVLVEAILRDLDNQSLSTKQQMENYLPEAVLLIPNQKEIRGELALREHLDEFGSNGNITINHQLVELSSFEDIVVAQGGVFGTFTPDDQDSGFPFETKNIILLKRMPTGDLKIWKVIYNAAPAN